MSLFGFLKRFTDEKPKPRLRIRFYPNWVEMDLLQNGHLVGRLYDEEKVPNAVFDNIIVDLVVKHEIEHVVFDFIYEDKL